MKTLTWIVYGLLLGYFLALNALYIAFIAYGLFQNRMRSLQAKFTDFDRFSDSPATIPVSVIVPAFNEQAIVVQSVLSILRSEHPEFEVIVVNDGSTDATLDLLRDAFALEFQDVFGPRPIPTKRVLGVYRSRRFANLKVIDKEQGGEADAVNAGVNHARYRYVLHTDADCFFEPDALLHTVRVACFDPATVVSVGGQLRPANGLTVKDGVITKRGLPRRFVERFQTIEYLSAFLVHRLAWSSINGSPVMAGGFSMWRRDTVLELGGYNTEVTHEDVELTLHAHEHYQRTGADYKLITVPDAVIWTQVPSTWRDLFRQRKRWQRVGYEVLWKYRRMAFNPRYGVAGLLTMPYLLLYEGLGPFVETFAYAVTVVLAIVGVLDWQSLLVFLAFSVGLTAITRLASLLIEVSLFDGYDTRAVLKLGLLALLEPLVYRPAQLPVRMYAFLEFLRGRKTHDGLARVAVGQDTAVA